MNVRIVVNRTDDVERFVNELVGQFPQHVIAVEGVDIPSTEDRKIPRGKGMLIWQLDKAAGGDMVKMADFARGANFKWISIKVAERGVLYNPSKINQAITELRARGISVRGWGYIYPENAVTQAKNTAKIVQDLGLDGYEMDIESEWKVGNLTTQATQYAQTLRNELGPNVGIGLCSFRYPSLHPLPWKEFLSICDYHAPQVYWVGATTETAPAQQTQKSHDQLIALKNIPFIPIGIATAHPIGTSIWNPTVAQLNNFSKFSKDNQYPGYGYYEWNPAFANKDWWEAIRAQ